MQWMWSTVCYLYCNGITANMQNRQHALILHNFTWNI